MKNKYFLLPILAGIVYLNTFAQPVIKAQRVAGGNDFDILFGGIYLTKDGGLIAGGGSLSDKSGEKTENNKGTEDYWIIKFDSAHNIQWDKTIGGSDYQQLNSLQQTRDGGYILGGWSTSGISGEKTDTSRGLSDYWVVKLDSAGKVQWDKTIGGPKDDNLIVVQQTCDGGYILGGSSFSKKSGEKTGRMRGNGDYWIVKLDSSHNIQWDKTIGGAGGDRLHSLQQTRDGGYILGGTSYSNISGEKTENGRGYSDFWIVKLGRYGKVQWDKTIGGNDNDELLSLQQTSDGGYILGGYSWSGISGEKTETGRGYSDFWIVKLDSLHNIEWDKTIGGNDKDECTSIQQTRDGGYILGGTSYSNISGEKTENGRGYSDFWIVKLGRHGKVQWDKTIGGESYDDPSCVKEISKNHFVVGGSSSSSGVSGDKTLKSRGGYDYWIVWLDYTTGAPQSEAILQNIAAPNTRGKKLTVYPNPARNLVTVNFDTQRKGKYIFEITGISGNILLRKETNAMQGANSTSFDISRFATGMYFITITRPDKTKESLQLSKE